MASRRHRSRTPPGERGAIVLDAWWLVAVEVVAMLVVAVEVVGPGKAALARRSGLGARWPARPSPQGQPPSGEKGREWTVEEMEVKVEASLEVEGRRARRLVVAMMMMEFLAGCRTSRTSWPVWLWRRMMMRRISVDFLRARLAS